MLRRSLPHFQQQEEPHRPFFSLVGKIVSHKTFNPTAGLPGFYELQLSVFVPVLNTDVGVEVKVSWNNPASTTIHRQLRESGVHGQMWCLSGLLPCAKGKRLRVVSVPALSKALKLTPELLQANHELVSSSALLASAISYQQEAVLRRAVSPSDALISLTPQLEYANARMPGFRLPAPLLARMLEDPTHTSLQPASPPLPTSSTTTTTTTTHEPAAPAGSSSSSSSITLPPRQLAVIAHPEQFPTAATDNLQTFATTTCIGEKRKRSSCPRTMFSTSMQIVVNTMSGKSIPIQVSPTDTITDLKAKIYEHEGIPASEQRLLLDGKELTDGTIADNNIKKDSKVQLLLRLVGGDDDGFEDGPEEPSEEEVAYYVYVRSQMMDLLPSLHPLLMKEILREASVSLHGNCFDKTPPESSIAPPLPSCKCLMCLPPGTLITSSSSSSSSSSTATSRRLSKSQLCPKPTGDSFVSSLFAMLSSPCSRPGMSGLLNHLGKTTSCVFVDIGCGEGALLAQIRSGRRGSHGYSRVHYIGIEIDSTQQEALEQKCELTSQDGYHNAPTLVFDDYKGHLQKLVDCKVTRGKLIVLFAADILFNEKKKDQHMLNQQSTIITAVKHALSINNHVVVISMGSGLSQLPLRDSNILEVVVDHTSQFFTDTLAHGAGSAWRYFITIFSPRQDYIRRLEETLLGSKSVQWGTFVVKTVAGRTTPRTTT